MYGILASFFCQLLLLMLVPLLCCSRDTYFLLNFGFLRSVRIFSELHFLYPFLFFPNISVPLLIACTSIICENIMLSREWCPSLHEILSTGLIHDLLFKLLDIYYLFFLCIFLYTDQLPCCDSNKFLNMLCYMSFLIKKSQCCFISLVFSFSILWPRN